MLILSCVAFGIVIGSLLTYGYMTRDSRPTIPWFSSWLDAPKHPKETASNYWFRPWLTEPAAIKEYQKILEDK